MPRTTDSEPNVRAAPNRLLAQPTPTAPNQVWVGDITYLLYRARPKQGGGWLNLATGKVKKLAGSVFMALTKSCLLPAYVKNQQPKAEALKSRSGTQSKFTKSGTSLAGTRKRLASELEDARGTLNFVTSAAIYTDETRPAVIQKVQATINRLQEQLAQPGAK